CAVSAIAYDSRSESKLLFSKASELVRDGAHDTGCCGRIVYCTGAETLPDLIDGQVGARSRQASFAARTASLVGKPERQFELHDRMVVEIRDGDRQQRDRPLARMVGKDAAHQALGDLGESPCRRNRF